MSISTKELHAALKTFFGFDKFKGLQEQVIVSLLDKKTHLLLCQQVEGNPFVINCLL